MQLAVRQRERQEHRPVLDQVEEGEVPFREAVVVELEGHLRRALVAGVAAAQLVHPWASAVLAAVLAGDCRVQQFQAWAGVVVMLLRERVSRWSQMPAQEAAEVARRWASPVRERRPICCPWRTVDEAGPSYQRGWKPGRQRYHHLACHRHQSPRHPCHCHCPSRRYRHACG